MLMWQPCAMLESYQKQQVLSQTNSVRVIAICVNNHYVIKRPAPLVSREDKEFKILCTTNMSVRSD